MKPVAVLISDIHFSLGTLDRASYALTKAAQTAHELGVNLIIAGDLHDTKANLRAECVNKIKECLSIVREPIILVGNHDLMNEKSKENALGFINRDAWIVEQALKYELKKIPVTFVPYFSDSEELKDKLKSLNTELVIMHQGLIEATAGHYICDKSAISLDDVKGRRVISGHYHDRQTIGRWDYLGNPYTLGFGEAHHNRKGFHILYDDLSLGFIEIDLPRHTIVCFRYDEMVSAELKEAILLVRISGPREKLQLLSKQDVSDKLKITQDFRLEFIPDEQAADLRPQAHSRVSFRELLNDTIEGLNNTEKAQKERLKTLATNLSGNE